MYQEKKWYWHIQDLKTSFQRGWAFSKFIIMVCLYEHIIIGVVIMVVIDWELENESKLRATKVGTQY